VKVWRAYRIETSFQENGMSKINTFDRTNLRLLRDDVQSALNAVAEKYGIDLRLGTGRFASENVTFNLEGSVIGAEGVVTREAAEFRQYADVLALEASDLGKTFQYRGQPYEIVGARLSNSKYPVLAKNRNGKVYKFRVADVREALGERAGLTRGRATERLAARPVLV
jgi:hypothetical protein